jgi:hypothetical protein
LVFYTIFSIAVFAIAAAYMSRWRAEVRRRNAKSWDAIVSELRLDWRTCTLGEQFVWNEDVSATPEQKWQRIQGAHGLWAMYQNARVMLEMADYAARNSDSVDRELLAALRSDALQIRVYVLVALAKYACTQVNDSICANASRAAAMYADMTARTAELLQGNGGQMVPSFVAAM